MTEKMARVKARKRWGSDAFAFFVGGTAFVGWTRLDGSKQCVGSANTFEAAFAEADEDSNAQLMQALKNE